MKKFIAMSMLVVFVLVMSLSSFAADYYTILPTQTSAVCLMEVSTSVILWANLTSTLSKGGYITAYGTDFGAWTYKSTQAIGLLIPKKIIPSDIRTVKYTYNAFQQKFTKVPVKATVPTTTVKK